MGERLSTDDLARRESPVADAVEPDAPARADEPEARLLDPADNEEMRGRWTGIQAGFVDEPRHAVEEADALVAELMQRLAESFSGERTILEGQWDRGEDVSTEDLRVALQRYRGFFDRLLAA